MKFIAVSTVLASLLTVAIATVDTSLCTVNTDAEPIYIGENKDVLVQTASCPPSIDEAPVVAEFKAGTLLARQTNTCGAQCMFSQIRRSSEKKAPPMRPPLATAPSSRMLFSRRARALSDLVNWLNTECGVAKGRHGGSCVAADQAWYILSDLTFLLVWRRILMWRVPESRSLRMSQTPSQ
ncbi:hypothetical protein BDV98DRAFT_633061 [Pterulicium gracile]|uniref:Uncharacterized protein n=1 Tax=Pterulicium gracile TaxID=1884261 RepID=A0A5C3Q6H5_9AGAR|nr:hypothetical protein BDV98DRAFT_633061 [Pterula gracilis]